MSGIVYGILTSIASVKAAIATSWLPALCIVAATVAVVGIVYTIRKVSYLTNKASKTIKAVKTKIKSGGVNQNKLKNHSVYVITRKDSTDVVYVGRTCNFNKRKAAHRKRFPRKDYDIFVIATNLSLCNARALEQTIITAYGIDTLKNMINSISPKKWSIFKREFKQMQTLIDSFFDPE